MSRENEESARLDLDFRKLEAVAATGAGVLPVVVQDAESGDVLTLAYANETALRETLARGVAVFWSTSRNELWVKGATSGDFLKLVDVGVNCEQNSLLYRVRRTTGGACHTRGADGAARPTCYYRKVVSGNGDLGFIHP
ncbi:MAG: hypothetical protein JJU00_10595 [Opitutales bacterium]|nr:hypothetical protein [Opitutales bacterium]